MRALINRLLGIRAPRWLLLAALGAALAVAAAWRLGPGRGGCAEHRVPMRDGVRLATTVCLPRGAGPWGAVMIRTPYGRRHAERARYLRAGFAVVLQDQRGRFDSEGVYVAHEAELGDGFDTVAWIRGQRWSDGALAAVGDSAVGLAATLAAASAPAGLQAVYASRAPASMLFGGRFVGGLFKEADTGGWMRRQGASEAEVLALAHRARVDERWRATDLWFHRQRIEAPVYQVGGWFDLFLAGSVEQYVFLETAGPEALRGRHRLVVGPFGHVPLGGDLEFPGAELPEDEDLRWLERHLRGAGELPREPPVRYYLMASAQRGAASPKNGWRAADRWPPPGAAPRRFFLQAGGSIAEAVPPGDAPATTYVFDPADPVPTVGGPNLELPAGPLDQRAIGARRDYLRFRSPPLDADLVIAGRVQLELWAASDAPDTDFVAKLVDEYPDGYQALIAEGALRARYRLGRDPAEEALLEPGVPARLEIDLLHTALVLEPGHRLSVHLSSSNAPRYDVNPGDGHLPGHPDAAPRRARNQILHDAAHPTALVVDVLPEVPPHEGR